jgi:putative intracellular protease/amidase/YHS domain-containing protein
MNKKLITAIFCIIFLASCNNKNDFKIKNKKEIANTGMMKEIFPKPKVDIKTVGILLYDGYAILDAMGPYHILGEMVGVKVFFVGRHKGMITTGDGMKVQCDKSISDVKQLDILIIPGGLKETYLATKDTTLLKWIKAIDLNSKYTASVCTGAWILAATGLLKDKEATTHWYGKKILREEFGVEGQDKRFIKSGKYWTSAGVTAGMDMSLALINEIRGEKFTKAAMLDLEYDPQPPFPGGKEQNTDKEIVEIIRSMYDAGLETAIHPINAFKAVKFDNKKDFICGMSITAGVADTAVYKGKIFGFCSKVCKQEFKKNPSYYESVQ